MLFNSLRRSVWFAGAALCYVQSIAYAGPITFDVRADLDFNPTGILASPGDVFLIEATGIVDIAKLVGGYKTDPDGTILETPPLDSDAFSFFRDRASPTGVEPLAGTQKIARSLNVFEPVLLSGAPYGALIAGFSPNPNPEFLDVIRMIGSDRIGLIGGSGTITTPDTGGYLVLGVNNLQGRGQSQGQGSFVAQVVVPEPDTLTLLVIGGFDLFAYRCFGATRMLKGGERVRY
jgi:hypothetical protein